MDQGGGFEGEFSTLLERKGITQGVVATEAPWQNGIVERHGGVLGEVMAAMIDQLQLRGDQDMSM